MIHSQTAKGTKIAFKAQILDQFPHNNWSLWLRKSGNKSNFQMRFRELAANGNGALPDAVAIIEQCDHRRMRLRWKRNNAGCDFGSVGEFWSWGLKITWGMENVVFVLRRMLWMFLEAESESDSETPALSKFEPGRVSPFTIRIDFLLWSIGPKQVHYSIPNFCGMLLFFIFSDWLMRSSFLGGVTRLEFIPKLFSLWWRQPALSTWPIYPITFDSVDKYTLIQQNTQYLRETLFSIFNLLKDYINTTSTKSTFNLDKSFCPTCLATHIMWPYTNH